MRKLLLLGLTLTLGVSLGQQSTSDEGGYKGPAVLNTAGYSIGRYFGRPMDFQWNLGVMGNYSTELTPANVDENGQIAKYSSAGGVVQGGVSGVKHGRDSTLSANLGTGYRLYTSNKGGIEDGVDVGGNLGYAKQVSLRTSIQIGASLRSSTYSWAGAYTPTIEVPIDGVQSPLDNGFDSRTTSMGATGGVTRMLSRRWAATGTVSGYYTKRHSDALFSSEGWQATGGMNYHINASSTTGVGYSFANYHTSDNFGDTKSHSLYWKFSKQFQNRWSLSGYAGVYYAEFNRLVAVPLDPLLAAIIGGQTVLEPFHETNWGPTVAVTASRAFRSSTLSFYYRRGITPGNAFYGSAENDTVGAQYSLTTSDRTNLGLGVSFSNNTTPGDDLTHQSYGANAGFNYRIGGGFNFTAYATYYKQTVTGGYLDRDRLYAGVGIFYGSGSRPLSLF